MSTATLLDRAEARAEVDTATAAAHRLRTTMAAVRLSFTWFGVSKSLTPQQKAQAAEAFDAEGQFLSATKKLLDTRHVAYRAVTAVRGKIDALWKSQSLPFPEPGVRLVRQDQVEAFARQVDDLRAELDEAVAELDRHFGDLKHTARERLGSLYNEQDYPESLRGLFGVSYDFPSVEPPGYLVALSPQLYEQEQARVAARFEDAVRLAEEAFLAEFARLVAHLNERISGTNDDDYPESLDGLFAVSYDFPSVEPPGYLVALSPGLYEQEQALVAEAQRVVRGVEPQGLRDSDALRQRVATDLSRVGSSLDGLLVDRPRRRIMRGTPQQGESS